MGMMTPAELFHNVLEIVRKQYPTLMPDIHIEISTLSRISFFFIQDIALNRKKYLDDNFEVNLACVLGMIKKRPERVVKLLKHYDSHSKDSLRMDVTRFMEKTKQLFQQERQSIETQFDPVFERIRKESKKPVGVIKSLFTAGTWKTPFCGPAAAATPWMSPLPPRRKTANHGSDHHLYPPGLLAHCRNR